MGRELRYTDDTYMERIYMTKVQKVGTSKGITLPPDILRAYGWERGDLLVFVTTTPEYLAIRRLTDKEIRAIKEQQAVIKH